MVEWFDGVVVVAFVGLAALLRRIVLRFEREIRDIQSPAPRCNHEYRFGGREERAGVHRVIRVCRKCGKTQVEEQD